MVIVRKEVIRQSSELGNVAQISVPWLVMLGLVLPSAGHAVEFNESFLRKGDGPVALHYFEKGNAVLPGSYDVDVYLNQSLTRRHTVQFNPDAEGLVRPAIPLGLLRAIGVDVAKLAKEGARRSLRGGRGPVAARALGAGAVWRRQRAALRVPRHQRSP